MHPQRELSSFVPDSTTGRWTRASASGMSMATWQGADGSGVSMSLVKLSTSPFNVSDLQFQHFYIPVSAFGIRSSNISCLLFQLPWLRGQMCSRPFLRWQRARFLRLGVRHSTATRKSPNKKRKYPNKIMAAWRSTLAMAASAGAIPGNCNSKQTLLKTRCASNRVHMIVLDQPNTRRKVLSCIIVQKISLREID